MVSQRDIARATCIKWRVASENAVARKSVMPRRHHHHVYVVLLSLDLLGLDEPSFHRDNPQYAYGKPCG